MCDNDNFDGLTFEPEEFIMRFASPAQSQTPPKHSPVWAYTTNLNTHGLVFADTLTEAMEKVNAYYGEKEYGSEYIEIDPDQDILEIM